MALVSVIVPVYNTEKYVSRCLDSILGQTLGDMEIICVDDGSTDSSPAILREYAKKDSRLRVITKENQGLVAARKTGVKEASGKYIGYVDSDDWIEPEMYETLCEYAEASQADMVTSGYIFEGNYISTHYDGVPEGLYEGERMDFLRENGIYNLKTRDVGLRSPLCFKLFLAETFREAQLRIPDEISLYEDKLCVITYLLRCDRAYVLRKAFYHYIIYRESMINKPDSRYLSKVNAAYQYLLTLYEHPLFTKSMRLQAELYVTEMLYKGINSRMGLRNFLWGPGWLCMGRGSWGRFTKGSLRPGRTLRLRAAWTRAGRGLKPLP